MKTMTTLCGLGLRLIPLGCKHEVTDPVSNNLFVAELYNATETDGSFHKSYEVNYSSDGIVTSSKGSQYDTTTNGLINLEYSTTYEYDTNDYLSKTTTNTVSQTKPTSPPAILLSQSIKTVTVYLYDNEKRLTQQLATFTNLVGSSSDNSTETRLFRYSSSGKLSTCTVTKRGNGVMQRSIFFYGNGRLSGYAVQPADSTRPDDYYRVDAQGLLIQTGIDDAYPDVRLYYDESKNLTKFEGYYRNPKPSFGREYMYDKSQTPKSFMPKFKGHSTEALQGIFDDRSPNNVIKETKLLPDMQGNLAPTRAVVYKADYSPIGLLVRKSWQDPTNRAYFRKYEYIYR